MRVEFGGSMDLVEIGTFEDAIGQLWMLVRVNGTVEELRCCGTKAEILAP